MTQSDEGSRRKLPPDFPNEHVLGTVGGAQDKLLLCRRDDGKYGSPHRSPEELLHRFEVADDLVVQLVAYFNRKKLEFPEWSDEKNIERIRLAVIQKAKQGKWPFSPAEQYWIMDRLRERCIGSDDAVHQLEKTKRESEGKSQWAEINRCGPISTGPSKGQRVPTAVEQILQLKDTRD